MPQEKCYRKHLSIELLEAVSGSMPGITVTSPVLSEFDAANQTALAERKTNASCPHVLAHLPPAVGNNGYYWVNLLKGFYPS